MPTNAELKQDSLKRAETALAEYLETLEYSEVEDAFCDALADLMHLARDRNVNFQEALERATRYFDGERNT